MQHLVFDVAHTLLHKPTYWDKTIAFLKQKGCILTSDGIMLRHKILSDSIIFPDKTSEDFYLNFNKQFFLSCGIQLTDVELKTFFLSVKNLTWEAYNDTQILKELTDKPLHILSNWDNSLEKKIEGIFPKTFTTIIGSEKTGDKKPNLSFYKHLIQNLNCEPEQITYVGDSYLLDYMPAKALGINAILLDRHNVYNGIGLTKINSLAELTKHL